MTTCGQKIIVLGGEPSVPTRNPEELQLIYILDTAKIRYPNDHQSNPSTSTSPTGSTENKRIQGIRSGSVDSPGATAERGQQKRGPGPRESVPAGSAQSTSPPNGSTLNSNNTSGTSVSSRLPRASLSQAPAGPPSIQQAPVLAPALATATASAPATASASAPRTNGTVATGQRSRTPTSTATPKARDVISPAPERSAPMTNGTRTPTQQRKVTGMDTTINGPSKDRSSSRQQGLRGGSDGTNSPSTPVSQSSGSMSKGLTNGALNGSPKSPERPEPTLLPQQATLVVREQAIVPKDSAADEEMMKEFEKVKHLNDWYASELALARRAGYTIQSGNNAILEERGADSLLDEERPFVEAMLILKGELIKVQGSVDAQATMAAKKIQEVERQRDVAVQEAVYAKAKFAALGGSSTPTPGGGSAEMANMDAEKMTDMSRKLAASLAAQAELSAKVEVLTAEIAAERKARHLADETAGVAQSRVSELDDFRNRAASEMESLRAELLDAERAFRDEAATGADAVAEAKLLKIDQDELSMRLTEALEDNSNYHSAMGEMRNAMEATASRTSTLARQLEEERLVKEGLERKLAQVKSEYEEKGADLESVNSRLRDVEELMEKYAEEARSANAAMAMGLQKVAQREIMSNSSLTDERVKTLQEQVESAKSLLKRSTDQADETGEKLAQAMQRVAGLEFQQGQTSKDAIALRRRMAEALDDVQKLKQENAEIQARLVDRQLEVDSISTKYTALKDILAERSHQPGFEKRRSLVLRSPNQQSGSGTPEQRRLGALEEELKASRDAHDDAVVKAEEQAQEVEQHFRDKLEQLETDYQSAVHYVKGTERLLKRMKDELAKNKDDLAKNKEELAQNTAENADLVLKIQVLGAELERQKLQLASLKGERDQMELQLLDVSQQFNDTRIHLERLENENSLLEHRAHDAEERVSFLLDRVGDSVGAYRRSTIREGANGLGSDLQSTHSSYYGGAPERNSGALDSLATELDALRTHWENTNKNYRLSSTFDFEKTPTSTEGGELSSSLAQWRQKLHQEEVDAAIRSDSGEGSRSPMGRQPGQGMQPLAG